MTPQEKDKFIVEWFGVGVCYHIWEWVGTPHSYHSFQRCKGCSRLKSEDLKNPDFSTWQDFSWLWGKMRTTLPAASTLWRKFLIYLDEQEEMPAEFQVINLIDNPEKFRDAVYDFLQTIRKEK